MCLNFNILSIYSNIASCISISIKCVSFIYCFKTLLKGRNLFHYLRWIEMFFPAILFGQTRRHLVSQILLFFFFCLSFTFIFLSFTSFFLYFCDSLRPRFKFRNKLIQFLNNEKNKKKNFFYCKRPSYFSWTAVRIKEIKLISDRSIKKNVWIIFILINRHKES